MKTKRINKRIKQVHKMQKPEKALASEATVQPGRHVLLKEIPKDIKKAKKLFKVGKTYKIQKPPKDHLNSQMSVYLKDQNGDVRQVHFPYFTTTPN